MPPPGESPWRRITSARGCYPMHIRNLRKPREKVSAERGCGAGGGAAARRIGKSDRVICIPLLVSWPRPLVTIPCPPSNRTHSHLARPFLFGFRNSDFFRPSHFGLRISSRPCHRIAAVGVEGPQHVESSNRRKFGSSLFLVECQEVPSEKLR